MNSIWTNVVSSAKTQETRVTHNRPSYHSVQVRQSLHSSFPQSQTVMPSPSAAPISEPPPTRKKIDWPQPVRSYVQRSFDTSNLLEDVTRPEMEAKLKETITAATDQDKLDKIDWDNLPLPQHMIRYQRAQPGWQQSSLESRIDRGNANLVTNSKKRKSLDLGNNKDNNQLLISANVSNGVEKNIQSKISDEKGTSKLQKSLEKRQRRFDGAYKNYRVSPSPEPTSGPVIGTCQTLEKRYFRLTSAPNPSQVRPEPVLRKTLDFLKKKWKKEENYSYICDQFKSLRQDLTVQHIANEFTVSVYETHARIALEKGDLSEYNQCQTQLRILNAQNLGGNVVEFKAYRILYFIHTSNRTALSDMLADLTTAEKEEPPIKHALCVRSALALGNYHRFFRLYQNTPNMGAYLMDMFIVRERLAALSNICKAYKPDVKLRFIVDELGFESDSDAAQFICDHNGQHLLEEKSDSFHVLTGKAGAIFEGAKILAFRKVDIKGQI
ncbi:putative sac3 ganp domain protein [Erysiphe necator]|uniref:Putative sac3 ganp domain protein n=1 Tax=Uncinula necator TaxID=52586 RepID=A0A0B1P1V2_UNCNE|nr:putative sac3 ganp domain protein [Erysiphe necator]